MSDEYSTEIFTALDEFQEVCDGVANESPVQRLQAEAQAFDTLAPDLAAVYSENPSADPEVSRVAKTVADVSHTLTKTDARQEITSQIQSQRQNGNGRDPLDEWIADNLNEVRVVQTTDRIDDTRYVWDFGTVTVETEGGPEGRGHFDWVNFRDSIDEAGGPYLADPNDPLNDSIEWREWIVSEREEKEKTKTNVGPRTNALRHLKNRIRRSDAFGSLSEAVDYSGVYVDLAGESERPDDAEPVNTDDAPQELPEWRVGTLYVDNQWANDAAEEFGISTRALQNEIDARGFMLEGHSKVATREYVDGQYFTFWFLDGDFATPAAYQPKGEAEDKTGANALESEEQDNEHDFGVIGEPDDE